MEEQGGCVKIPMHPLDGKAVQLCLTAVCRVSGTCGK